MPTFTTRTDSAHSADGPPIPTTPHPSPAGRRGRRAMRARVVAIAAATIVMLGVSAAQAAAVGVSSPHRPSASSSQAHTKTTTPSAPSRPSGSQSSPQRRPSTATPPSRPKSTINPKFKINRGPNKATPKVKAPGAKTASPGANKKPTPQRSPTSPTPQHNPPATSLGLGDNGSAFADDSDDDGLYEPHNDGDPDLPVMHIPTLHGGGLPLPGLKPPAVAPRPAEPPAPAPARPAAPAEPAKPATPPATARPKYAYPNAPRPPEVPSDYVAGPTRNGDGTVYRPPNSNGDEGSIRIQNPNARYPDGYLRVYNKDGKPIDINGRVDRPLGDSHFPIRPDGSYDFPKNWKGP